MLALGALIGGFVNGLAGFGTGLFALVFFLNVMVPLQAVAVIVAFSVFAGGLGLYVVYRDIGPNKHAIMHLIAPGLIGVPIGVWALSYVSVDMLRILVALLLVLYGGYFTIRAELPQLKGRFVGLDMLIGFIGGVLGGLAALSGALPTMWYAMRAISKEHTRAILQCYNFTLLSITLTLLMANGAFDEAVIIYCIITIPIAMAAARLGLMVYARLTDNQFRRLLVSLTLFCGLLMVYQIFR